VFIFTQMQRYQEPGELGLFSLKRIFVSV